MRRKEDVVMVPTVRRWLSVALLPGILAWAAPTHAQAPPLGSLEFPSSFPAAPFHSSRRYQQTEPTGPDVLGEEVPSTLPQGMPEPEFLQSLPRPPDQPGSLFDPAPPVGPPPVNLERPYFEQDPVLDPRQWPRPGWFVDADVALVKPHVNLQVADPNGNFGFPVTTSAGNTILVQLGTARLDWTASPRFEAGYRFASGFGEISLSNRFFDAFGRGSFAGPDGPATRTTRFFVNHTDLDYASREYTPFANWQMKWRVGFRSAETIVNTRVNEPFALAAAGSGFFSLQQTNRTIGFGPHFGVELLRQLRRPGLSLVSNIDGASLFTTVHQRFFATNTVLAPGGGFATGSNSQDFKQDVPVLIVQLGLDWRPPRLPNDHLYLGYMGQFWYQFATNSNNGIGPFLAPAPSQFDMESIVFRWSRNY
jgi:hypothetical protein